MPPRAGQPRSTWIGARPTPGATALLVTLVASYLVLLFGALKESFPVATLLAWLGMQPAHALGTRPWQLLTSAFMHAPRDFAPVVGDVIGVWVFATAVELRTSRRHMLTVFFVAQLVGAFAMAGLGRVLAPAMLLTGASPGVMGLAVAFGFLYGPVPLSLFGVAEMKGRTLAWLCVGLGLVVGVLARDWLRLAGDVTGTAAGLVLEGGVMVAVEHTLHKWRLKRLRRRYRVIPGGRAI